MGDIGSPSQSLVGNTLVLSRPYGIKTIEGTTLFDINGWGMPLWPATNNFYPLGTDTLSWSDLFLGTGATINFADDNFVLTHSSGLLTLTTGALALGSHVVTANGTPVAITTAHNVSLAEMNAGHTLLNAVAGLKYRIINCVSVARGHNLAASAAATGFAVYGTQGTVLTALHSVLLAAALADTAVPLGAANTSIAETTFDACDAASAITCKATSAGAFDLITSHSIDIVLTYTLEA